VAGPLSLSVRVRIEGRIIKINYLAQHASIHSYFKYYKMKIFRILLAASAVISIGMTGCSKGNAGPAGPAGPSGPDSVFSSQWILLNFTGSVDQSSGDSVYDETIPAVSITKAILDSGIVLTYVNADDPTSGLYDVYDVSGLPEYFADEYSIGTIYITSFQVNQSGTPFRYVTIPGNLVQTTGTKRTYKGYTQEELKAMPYNQVQKVLTNN
jgi:hypothetical protein